MTVLIVIGSIVLLAYGINLASAAPAARHVGARARLAEARRLVQPGAEIPTVRPSVGGPRSAARAGVCRTKSRRHLTHSDRGPALGVRHPGHV